MDGSALDFARLLDEAGNVDQDAEVTEAVICEKLSIGEEDPDQKYLYVEPYDGFEVTMRVNYPPPILEQQLTFNAEQDSFLNEISPARSFNTFQNIDMAQKMGKVGSGYLNSHIIIYDGKVINTELRFTDEFVRHKILDLIGDLFLLGYPLRGRVVANMTSTVTTRRLFRRCTAALPDQAERNTCCISSKIAGAQRSDPGHRVLVERRGHLADVADFPTGLPNNQLGCRKIPGLSVSKNPSIRPAAIQQISREAAPIRRMSPQLSNIF